MDQLKEAQIHAQDFPPYTEAYQNAHNFDEFVSYLAEEMGRDLEKDELEEATNAYYELDYKYKQ